MKTFQYLSIIAIGFILASLVLTHKEKKRVQTENNTLKLAIQSFSEEKKGSDEDGGFTILPQNTKTITLKGFVGTVRFYQNLNFENLKNNSPAEFSPIGEEIEIRGGNKTIELSAQANAIFKKSIGGAYKMDVSM